MPALYDLPQLYDRVIAPGPCEAFYREEARHAAGPVLELACGTGRVTLPLALDGHEIVGLDASSTMLDAARSKAAGISTVNFVQADMRSFTLGRRFALIILSCNSLAHLATNEDLRACLTRVQEHLQPDGTFAFDIVNPDVPSLARPSSGPVPLHGPPQGTITVQETASYDPVAQIKTAQWRVRQEGQPPCELSPFRLRQIFPQELPLLLEAAGLELVARYGDFDRGPFTGESLNQICRARLA